MGKTMVPPNIPLPHHMTHMEPHHTDSIGAFTHKAANILRKGSSGYRVKTQTKHHLRQNLKQIVQHIKRAHDRHLMKPGNITPDNTDDSPGDVSTPHKSHHSNHMSSWHSVMHVEENYEKKCMALETETEGYNAGRCVSVRVTDSQVKVRKSKLFEARYLTTNRSNKITDPICSCFRMRTRQKTGQDRWHICNAIY